MRLAANAEPAIEAASSSSSTTFVAARRQEKRAQELIANNGMHAGVVLPEEEGRLHCADGLLDEKISGSALAWDGADRPLVPRTGSSRWLAVNRQQLLIGFVGVSLGGASSGRFGRWPTPG